MGKMVASYDVAMTPSQRKLTVKTWICIDSLTRDHTNNTKIDYAHVALKNLLSLYLVYIKSAPEKQCDFRLLNL